jgi:Co/Zn/Cd efflux system component
MASCCEQKSCDLERLPREQARVLWIVLVINAAMFAVELVGGWLSGSVSLGGDALDMLGDAVTYASSLVVVSRGMAAKAQVAVLKGSIMLLSAVAVLAAAIYRTVFRELPVVETMGAIGVMALVANLACLVLLTRHRRDDINMSSVWLCSRNDIIANTSVLAAAGLVLWTRTPWPDLIVGLGLTILFTSSAWTVLRDARRPLGRPA